MFSFGVSLVLVKIVPVIAQLQLQSPLTYLECVFDILSVCFVFWRVSGVTKLCRLQLSCNCKAPLTYLVIRCPYCKTLNYAVEYRGVKTKEEKGIEQLVSAHTHRVLFLSRLLWSIFRQLVGIGNSG